MFIFELIGWSGLIFITLMTLIYIRDFLQPSHSILRNFPIIGHMRFFLERQGVYFRQYFFANDREELPFNRATRTWVYQASKKQLGIIGFGSNNDLRQPGSIIFVNSPYASLAESHCKTCTTIIGPDTEHPFISQNIANISAMSYGALSTPAIRALSIGAEKAKVWLNTGEGGLSPYHLEGNCDLIFQIGTAKYGVRDHNGKLSDQRLKTIGKQVKAFEIKLSQGAKPGKGGILPAIKVTQEVADIRNIPVGESSISPNRHLDIKTPNDLLDMIDRIRTVTGKPVGFKTVISSHLYIEQLCEAILKRGVASAPDFITLDGGEGGTAASPLALADHVGLPLSESIFILVDTLYKFDLKKHIKVIASGKLVTPEKVAWALCAGADAVNTARGFMFALGCIQSMQCHQNTCPTGITTHNKRLQRGLVVDQKAQRVAQYAHKLNADIHMLAHSCGLNDARHFNRTHVRIVQQAGKSMLLSELYPYPENFSV